MRSTVSGKMQPNWLSKIGKSRSVTDAVDSSRARTKQLAEAKVQARGYKTGPGFYHFGSKKASTGQSTRWSATGLIWCESPMARKHTELLDSAAAASELRLKKRS